MCQIEILTANFKLFHNIETKCSMYKLYDIQKIKLDFAHP